MVSTSLRTCAAVLMTCIVIWLLFFLYTSVWNVFTVRFVNPSPLLDIYGLAPDTALSTAATNYIFVAAMIRAVFGVGATICALYALNEARLGHVFTFRITRAMIATGILVSLAVTASIITYNVERNILFEFHPDLTYQFTVYSPYSELPLFLCGLALAFIGWVSTEAVHVYNEHQKIV